MKHRLTLLIKICGGILFSLLPVSQVEAQTAAKDVFPSIENLKKTANATKEIQQPFFSGKTHFMQVADTYERNLFNVSEGLFCVANNDKISVWDINGCRLFGPDWLVVGNSYDSNRRMEFDHGALLAKSAKRNKLGKEYYAILYADRSVRNLDPALEFKSGFIDGITIAKKRLSRSSTYHFMDTQGVLLASPANLDGGYDSDLRPLACGMRAYRTANKKWGFVNEKCQTVLQPQWDKVRNFSEGYAWVFKKVGDSFYDTYEASLIDKTGKVIRKLSDFSSNADASATYEIGDVSSGRYYVMENDKAVYYNLEGQVMAVGNHATPFLGGSALMEVQKDGRSYVVAVDKDFHVQEAYPTFDSDGFAISGSNFLVPSFFGPSGLAVIETGSYVIDSKGHPMLKSFEQSYDNRLSGFVQFGKDGYGIMKDVDVNGKNCLAFVRNDGEVAWLFHKEAITKEELAIFPQRGGEVRVIDADGKCSGGSVGGGVGNSGKEPKVKETYYTVKVVCTPPKGGTAKLIAPEKIQYGDTVRVKAKANEGYYLASVTVEKKDVEDKPYIVTHDATVEVRFNEKIVCGPGFPPPPEPRHVNYQGTMPVDIFLDKHPFDMTVYAELSNAPNISSPFGEHTYGYLSIMVDPEKKYSTTTGHTNLFCSPFKIVGYQRDSVSGKQYMVMDGGTWAYHDLALHGGLMALFINSVLCVNGFDAPVAMPRRYRVEMLDVNQQTGEFQMGMLEAFSREYGWVPSNDKRVHKSTSGFMVTLKDVGFPADAFKGCAMKLCEKRDDVLWYPPKSWYVGNPSVYKNVLDVMTDTYKKYSIDFDPFFAIQE